MCLIDNVSPVCQKESVPIELLTFIGMLADVAGLSNDKIFKDMFASYLCITFKMTIPMLRIP